MLLPRRITSAANIKMPHNASKCSSVPSASAELTVIMMTPTPRETAWSHEDRALTICQALRYRALMPKCADLSEANTNPQQTNKLPQPHTHSIKTPHTLPPQHNKQHIQHHTTTSTHTHPTTPTQHPNHNITNTQTHKPLTKTQTTTPIQQPPHNLPTTTTNNNTTPHTTNPPTHTYTNTHHLPHIFT